MNNEYTQDEINDILLEKPLDDFYFAIIEVRPEITDETLEFILKGENIRIDDENDRALEKYKKDLMGIRLMYRKGLITKDKLKKMFSKMYIEKYFGIITMIDGKLYNVFESSFLNLDNVTILNYQNVTNYYNNSDAEVVIVSKEELGEEFKNDIATLWFRNVKYYYAYLDYYLPLKYDCDLTSELISEMKNKKVNRIDLN